MSELQQAIARTVPARRWRRRRRETLLSRTVITLFKAVEHALYAEELAKLDGLLQRIDPRVKVVGMLGLILAVVLARSLTVILLLFAAGMALAAASRIPIRALAARAWLGALLFIGPIATPAIFITPGRVLYRLPLVHWPATAQGVTSAALLIARVEATATFSILLILTTPWAQVLKALRVLRAPVVLVVMLGMTYRYIFLFLQTARDMFESRQSRIVGRLSGSDQRRLAAASIGILLSKSLSLSNEVYLAMQARGFRGEAYTIDEFKTTWRDWAWLAAVACFTLLAFRFG